MMRSFGLVVLAALVGCAIKEGEVAVVAAHDLECPEDQIQLADTTKEQDRVLKAVGAPTHAIARGCGKRMVYARMCQADRSSCDWYSVKKLRLDPLLERAAFDLHCSKDKIATQQLATGTIGVSGCEQRASYVWNCPHSGEFFSSSCNWVLNSDSRPEAAPAQ